MPAKEGLRLDVDQSVLPGEEPREKNQRQPCSVGRPPRFDFALEVEGELFPEEHIFRFDRSGRTSAQQQESESIPSQRGKYEDQAKHGMRSSHVAGSMPRVNSGCNLAFLVDFRLQIHRLRIFCGGQARAVAWLLSEEFSYVTGSHLVCDGGILAKASISV